MANKSPAFQFYPSDFLSDERVAVMTNQEVGCYIKLICYCWREDSIPSSMAQLSKMCFETESDMEKLWLNISKCFTFDSKNNRFIHKRLKEERKKQAVHRQERSESGRKGAKLRWDKNDGSAIAQPWLSHSSAMQQPMAKNGSPSSSSTSSSSSIHPSDGGGVFLIQLGKEIGLTTIPESATPLSMIRAIECIGTKTKSIPGHVHHNAGKPQPDTITPKRISELYQAGLIVSVKGRSGKPGVNSHGLHFDGQLVPGPYQIGDVAFGIRDGKLVTDWVQKHVGKVQGLK